MKYERTPQFVKDWRRLTPAEQEAFQSVVFESFVPACDRRAKDPSEAWPKALRVKQMKSDPNIMEMTWELADGRATFEWIVVENEPRIRWRRIGGHAVLGHP